MILFVDDDVHLMASYLDELEDDGFTVRVCRSADECLDAVGTTHELDAVILDVMMAPGSFGASMTDAGMNTGIVLLQELRKRHRDLPVVVLTNRVDAGDLQVQDPHTMVVGKCDVLPPDLVLLLRRLLNGTDGTES